MLDFIQPGILVMSYKKLLQLRRIIGYSIMDKYPSPTPFEEFTLNNLVYIYLIVSGGSRVITQTMESILYVSMKVEKGRREESV